MGNKLFDNIGKKIMGIVKFCFYTNVVLVGILVLIASIIAMSDDFVAGMLVLVIGAIIGAVYLLFVYVGMLCVYGFGELVQCNIEQKNILRTMSGGTGFAAKESRMDPVRWEPEKKPATETVGSNWSPASKPSVERTVTADRGVRKNICPHCGARQPEGTERCKYCGTAMH